jgi:hypothetical protein
MHLQAGVWMHRSRIHHMSREGRVKCADEAMDTYAHRWCKTLAAAFNETLSDGAINAIISY